MMTSKERDDLSKLAKAGGRVAKAGVDQRKAELLANVEGQLAAIYKPADDPVWKEAAEAVQVAVEEGNAKITEVCERLGVREEFRPGISAHWYGRGENAAANRRTELRRLAERRLDADAKKAKLVIESATLEMLTTLVSGSLESAEAKSFLESMPTPEALMPPIEIDELESISTSLANTFRRG